MFDFLFIGFALLLWLPSSTSGPDQPFATGFEDNVHISTDRPDFPVWAIDSTNHNATFVTSSTFLVDGKISIPTRMTWDVGAQTTASYTEVVASSFTPFTIEDGQKFVVFVAFPKNPYAPPAGVLVQYIFMSSGVPVGGGTTRTVQTDDGAVIAIFVYQATGTFTTDAFHVVLNNDQNGSPWIASGWIFDIGEIWFGTLAEFKNTTDPKRKLVDGVTNRRSHNNTNQPLFVKPYYEWTYGFTPMPNASAYGSSSTPTYSQVEYALGTVKAALIIGRIFTPGTTTQNQDDINYYTAFGRPATGGLQQMQAHKDGPYWMAGLTFETQPA